MDGGKCVCGFSLSLSLSSLNKLMTRSSRRLTDVYLCTSKKASTHRSRHLLQPGMAHLVEVLPERPAGGCASTLAFTFHVAPVAPPKEQSSYTYINNGREKWDQTYVM